MQTDQRLVRELTAALGPVFTRRDAERAGVADRADLNRLLRGGYVRNVRRGVYEVAEQPRVMIANELALALAMLPAAEEAYISWRSALSHWGLTEQMPRSVCVAVQRPRPAPRLPGARIVLVVQRGARRYGIAEETVAGAKIRITTPEKAVIDGIDRPDLSGGLGEIVRALSARSRLDYGELVGLALRHPSQTLVRRLGYLMDTLMLGDTSKLRERVTRSDRVVRLDLDGEAVAEHDPLWRIADNVGQEEIREMAGA